MKTVNAGTDRPGVVWLARIAWILIALAYLSFFLVELQLDTRQLFVPCVGPDCNWAAISAAEFEVLDTWGLTSRAYAYTFSVAVVLQVAVYWVIGALIFWRQGSDWAGFIVSLILVVMPIASFADAENVSAAYPALQIPTAVLSIVGLNIIHIFIYIFPNGRLYPGWAHIPMGIGMLASSISLLANNRFLSTLPPLLEQFLTTLFASFLLLGLVFQGFRYFRNSNQVEKQQTRWVLFGIATLVVGPFMWDYLYPGGTNFPPGEVRLLAMTAGWIFINLSLIILPVTLLIAIMRYRLWNIDLIIRRTLVYGSLTGILAVLYFGGVVLLQNIFGGLFGSRESPLITIISTLTIAALFNPIRYRIQQFIDRRFYRRKYDTAQTLASFAANIRNEVNLDRLSGALLGVVEETLEPENISLWLTK